MTTSREAHYHLISPSESGPDHITNDVLRPGVIPESRQASLLESSRPDEHYQTSAPAASVRDRDLHPWPAPVSSRKTSVEPSVERLSAPDRQSARSCARFKGDGWELEVIAATCSICCFVAIVAVLKAYDGQRSPSLAFGITLNAIVSILSTTAKSSIMFGITAAIGQAKWDRFSTEGSYYRLLDLEHIDQASRGPLGSFRMLFTRAGRSIASVGAIATLLMLAVDPFVQQILVYQQEPSAVSSESAWTEQVLAPTIFSNNSDPAYYGAINSALWHGDSSYERKAHCPTGNCTYPSYQSMGLCMASRDVPLDQVHFVGIACDMAHANTATGEIIFDNMTYPFTKTEDRSTARCHVSFWGDSTTYLDMVPAWSWGDTPEGETQVLRNFPLDFTGSMESEKSGQHDILGFEAPLLTLGRLSMSSPLVVGNQSISLRFEKAEQVVIAFCAGDYLTTVSQGITSTSGANMSSASGFSYLDSNTVLGSNATCWTSGPEKATFTTGEIKHANHGRYITEASPLSFCTDNWGWGADIAYRLSTDSSFYVTSNFTNLQDGPNTTGPLWLQTPDMDEHSDVLRQIQSRSLEDISRSITASLNALFREYSSDRIIGSYIEYHTVVRVQWPWLTLPIAVEMLGFVFLVLTALRSPVSRSPWKGSILAAIFHGLGPSGDYTGNLSTVTSMEREASKTMVQLKTSDTGRRFLSKRPDHVP